MNRQPTPGLAQLRRHRALNLGRGQIGQPCHRLDGVRHIGRHDIPNGGHHFAPGQSRVDNGETEEIEFLPGLAPVEQNHARPLIQHHIATLGQAKTPGLGDDIAALDQKSPGLKDRPHTRVVKAFLPSHQGGVERRSVQPHVEVVKPNRGQSGVIAAVDQGRNSLPP